MSILELTINGEKIGPVEVPQEVMMIEYLHEYRNLTGTKFGCGQGACNACVVIIDNDDGTKELKNHVLILLLFLIIKKSELSRDLLLKINIIILLD